MLGFWAEFMPLFVVRYFARKYCERIPCNQPGKYLIIATKDCSFLIED